MAAAAVQLLTLCTPGAGTVIQIPEDLQVPEQRPCKYAWVFKFNGDMEDVAVKPRIAAGRNKDVDITLFTDTVRVILQTPTPGAIIRYTLNGKEPDHSSAIYEGPLILNNTTYLKAFTSKEGMVGSRVVQMKLQKVNSFKWISFSNPPSSKYPANGPLTLGNGVTGSVNFNDHQWLGWEGADFGIVLEPKINKPYSGISIGFLQDQGSWIFLPKKVKVEVSNDGKTFVKVAEKNLGTAIKDPGKIIKRVTFSFYPKEYKYVRITAENQGVCPSWHPGAGGKAWLFVDEIMVE